MAFTTETPWSPCCFLEWNYLLRIKCIWQKKWDKYGLPWWLSSKESTSNSGATEIGSIPLSGRSPGGSQGSPLQYSWWGNPMDRRVWRAIINRVSKSCTRLKQLSSHTHRLMTVRYVTDCWLYFAVKAREVLAIWWQLEYPDWVHFKNTVSLYHMLTENGLICPMWFLSCLSEQDSS